MSRTLALAAALAMLPMTAFAQVQGAPVVDYGAPLSLAEARAIAGVAEAEARRLGVRIAISIVEPSCMPVWFERIDGVTYGAVELAPRKACTAAKTRRSSKTFADLVAGGALGLLTVDVVASPGGVPIIRGGKVVGAIGISGGTPAQDEQIAQLAVAEPLEK